MIFYAGYWINKWSAGSGYPVNAGYLISASKKQISDRRDRIQETGPGYSIQVAVTGYLARTPVFISRIRIYGRIPDIRQKSIIYGLTLVLMLLYLVELEPMRCFYDKNLSPIYFNLEREVLICEYLFIYLLFSSIFWRNWKKLWYG